ncbi:MAG TPA: hypothetical protein VKN18_23770 [Blastocatellia bacterium]|nr:hypothetical protein [Blastocatellia bacterium]
MVRAMHRERLLELVPGMGVQDLEPRELLRRAAYFADFATMYPHLRPKELRDEYVIFLSPKLLDEFFPILEVDNDAKRD